MQLLNKTKNQILADNINVADSFLKRMIGLLAHKNLDPQTCMWFDECRSIHTIGMRFALDLIFVDKNMVVKKVFYDVKPGRITLPVWSARSVFEFSAGSLASLNVQPGDQLDMVH